MAEAVGARPDEVVFTSWHPGGQAAVAGLALGRRRIGFRVITTAVDHSSVLTAAAAHGEHIAVGVDAQGHLDLDEWATAIAAPGVAAACLHVANHEVGTIEPYAATVEAARQADVPVVLDATARWAASTSAVRPARRS